jgi:hypothetical protein
VGVGRVGDAEEDALAALEERQHAMLGQELVADQPDDIDVDRQGVQIEQRHAEFVRGGDRDVARLGGARVHKLGHDARLAIACVLQRVEHRRLLHDAVLNEALGKAAEP